MKKILLLCSVFLTVFVFSVLAQGTVSGKVTDDEGEGLPGVNVVIKGTTTGVSTNLDGNFRLSVEEGAILIFTFVGFERQEVEVGNRSTVDITLGGVTELQEVVVTALGVERNEKALGYSVQEVAGDDIVRSGASNAADALVGKASGVQITRSSGSAGGGTRILIRGQTSMVGNNQPIIVIDGVRTNNESLNTERNTGGTAQSNRLMDLNVADIETINVLKGAAATALYGTAGSTGVIIITTKKGKKGGKLSININSSVAFDNITTTPKLQNVYAQGTRGLYRDPSTGNSGSWGPKISELEYATDRELLTEDFLDNASNFYGGSYGSTDVNENGVIEPNELRGFDNDGVYLYDRNGYLVPTGMGNGTPANSYDNVGDFFQTGVTQTNSISISGGSDVATFRFSASNHDAQGVIPNEEYMRKTASVATTLQASQRLSFQTTINYARSDYQRVQQGSNTSGLLLGMYRTPGSFDNSNGFGHDAYNEPSSYIFPTGNQRNYRGGGGYDNPYWVINNALRDEEVHRIFGSFITNYKVNDWLNFNLNIGTDVTNDFRKQNFDVGSRTNTTGTILLDEFTTRQTDFYLNVNGQGNLANDITLNYLAGVNMFNFDRHNAYTQGDALVFQGFLDISNATSISALEDDTRYRTIGFYGQTEFGWRNTAFVTLSARQDYDSRLVAPGEFDAAKVGFFYPSVSTSFVFTELLPSSKILTFGKIRASWAQVGSPPPNAYSTSTPYENTASVGDGWGTNLSWPINGVTSFELDNLLGNPDIEPEISTTIELGADLRFLDGKIGLDVTYFTRETDGAILNASLPLETGYSSIWLNSGVLSASGIEVTLNATPVSSNDFNWNTQVNFTKNETVVDELAPGIERLFLAGFTTAGSFLIKGNPYGAIVGGAYLREEAGTDADTDLNIPGGEIVINNDPNSSEYGYQAIDEKQRSIGDPNPDFIVGWNNTLNYKNFSFSFLIDWREGGDLWNGTAWALSFFGKSQLTADTREEDPIVLNGVINVGTDEAPDYKPNNIAIVRDENYWTSSLGGFGSIGEQFVQDGGWVKLREVSLSYSLPSNLFGDNTIFKGGSIGFTGRNLWNNWAYDGVDPETSLTGTGNGQGFDYFNQPSTKTMIFNLGLNF